VATTGRPRGRRRLTLVPDDLSAPSLLLRCAACGKCIRECDQRLHVHGSAFHADCARYRPDPPGAA
jgi:ferredoxin